MRAALSPNNRRVLVDTSAYFAAADPRDSNAPHVPPIARHIGAARYRQFTTNFIVAETHALLLNRAGRYVANRVLADIDASAAVIVRVSARDEERAREISVSTTTRTSR